MESKMKSLRPKVLIRSIVAILASAAFGFSAHAEPYWDGKGDKCVGTTKVWFARIHGTGVFDDWMDTCRKTPWSGDLPTRCLDKAPFGVWGEWEQANHPTCIPNDPAKLEWGQVGNECRGSKRVEYARIWNIESNDWKPVCERTPAKGVSQLSNGKVPSTCIDKGLLGTWGEWHYSNHPTCGPHFEADLRKDGCQAPNRQVYSARMINDVGTESWEETCARTAGPDKFGNRVPDACRSDALRTGMWGLWYDENETCETPLEWGEFKDEGCVKDQDGVAASATGMSGEGYRVWSSVLWNIGGDWLEACRFAPVDVTLSNHQAVNMPYPTACTIAEADEALSWVTGAVLGAGTAFVTSPTGPYAIAAAGAAMALGQKGAEEVLFANIDTGLNVWGFIWVEDASCGVVDRTEFPPATTSNYTPLSGANQSTFLDRCPTNATDLSGTVSCACEASQTGTGQVWGSDTYTADSSICRAGVHAGRIPMSGGRVILSRESGRESYDGTSRNGVETKSYGRWDGSFQFE